MKHLLSRTLVLAPCLILIATTRAQERKPATMLEIAKELEATRVQEKRAAVKPKSDTSMLDGMEILVDSRHWTAVPANSILAKPKNHAPNIGGDPKGKTYLPWFEFLNRNRSWLSSYAVDLEAIKGQRPLTEAQSRQIEHSRHVIVATFKNGPVSVLSKQKEDQTDEK